MNRKKTSLAFGSAAILSIVIIWKFAAVFIHAPLILPAPEETFFSFLKLIRQKEFYYSALATFFRTLLALFISCTCGGLLGYACAAHKKLEAFFAPLILIIQSTPVVAIILLSMFVFSSSQVPIFVAVLMVLPMVMMNVKGAFKNSDENFTTVLKCYGFTKKQIFFYGTFLNASQVLKATLTSAVSMTWKVVAAGEVLSLPRFSLGSSLSHAQTQLETARVFSLTIAIILGSFISLCLVKILLKLFSVKHLTSPDFIDKKKLPKVNCGTQKKAVAIIGKNGCGKTTWMNKKIRGLLEQKTHRISFVPQTAFLLQEYTVFENIYFPLRSHFTREQAEQRAMFFIKQLELFSKKDSLVKNLSGGQRQRVCIARALAFPSSEIFFDEAFSSQDLHLRLFLQKFISEILQNECRTLTFITHDIHCATYMSDELFCLKKINPEEFIPVERTQEAVQKIFI